MSNHAFDLEERTAKFGEDIVAFCKGISVSVVTRPLIDQLVRAGTSVGANYAEADDADGKRDFRHKISICKKEARESKHFLRMLIVADPSCKERAEPLWQEAKELNLIFNAIYGKVKE